MCAKQSIARILHISTFGESSGIDLWGICFSIYHFLRIRIETYDCILFTRASVIKFARYYEALGRVSISRCNIIIKGFPPKGKTVLSMFYLYHVNHHTLYWDGGLLCCRHNNAGELSVSVKSLNRHITSAKETDVITSAKENRWATIQIPTLNFRW